MFVKL
ncbi:UNVERIFIED_CONTAM: hypothetical protein GTU68_021473 [Idotea baltica]